MKFHKVECEGPLVLENKGSNPSGIEGRIYMNSSGNKIYYYSGSAWRSTIDTDTYNSHLSDFNTLESDFNSHESDTNDPHSTLTSFQGVFSRYNSNDEVAKIDPNVDPGSANGSSDWYNITFPSSNINWNSPVSYDSPNFTLPTGYVYLINWYAGIERGTKTIGSEVPPNYIIGVRIVSGDTTQTLNYGSGEGGSKNEAIVIGSKAEFEVDPFDNESHFWYSATCVLKPSSQTTIKLGAFLNTSSIQMWTNKPSINIISFKTP